MIELHSERLTLREMELADIAALAAYQAEAAYRRHYAETPDANAIVEAAMNWAREESTREKNGIQTS